MKKPLNYRALKKPLKKTLNFSGENRWNRWKAAAHEQKAPPKRDLLAGSFGPPSPLNSGEFPIKCVQSVVSFPESGASCLYLKAVTGGGLKTKGLSHTSELA